MDISTLRTILEKGFICRYEAGYDEITAYVDELNNYSSDPDPEVGVFAQTASCALRAIRELSYGTINSTFDEFVKVIILLPKCNDPLIRAMFLKTIGDFYSIFGVFDIALQSFESSDQIATENGFDFLHIADLIAISAIYAGQKQYSKADKLMSDRTQIKNHQGFNWFEIGLMNNTVYTSIPFKPLDQLEGLLLDLIAKDVVGQKNYIAQILDTYGELLEFHGENERALAIYQKAYDSIDTAKNQFDMVNIMFHLSNALMSEERFDDAKVVLSRAEQIVTKVVLYHFLPELHRQLAKYHNALKNESLAIHHHILYHLYTTEERNAPISLPDLLDTLIEPASNSLDVELTRMDVRAQFYDPQTGLWDRFLFLSIGFRLVTGKKLTDFCMICFKLNEGTQFKPRSVGKVLKILGDGIRDRIGEDDIAARYSKDSVLILIAQNDVNEAYLITKTILDQFLISAHAEVEPWIASLLDIGITRGADDERYLLQVIERLNVEMFKNKPASGGMIMTFEPYNE